MQVMKISNRRPDLVLVEKSVSRVAQDFILNEGITLSLNIKQKLMERLSRSLNIELLGSIGNHLCCYHINMLYQKFLSWRLFSSLVHAFIISLITMIFCEWTRWYQRERSRWMLFLLYPDFQMRKWGKETTNVSGWVHYKPWLLHNPTRRINWESKNPQSIPFGRSMESFLITRSCHIHIIASLDSLEK